MVLMKNSSLKICDATIHPGEKATLALPLPEQYSCSPMYMPIKVINGKQPGPCLVTFSTLNGNEFNGLEILNQLFDLISPNELNGTLITVPVFNVYGLTHFPKVSPSGVTIANSFPGNENGTFGERIAYIFTEEILKKADYCVEFQTGSLNHEILPQIYCNFDDREAKKLAKAFQAPVITEVETSSSELRMTTENLNIPLLVYEAGEAMRFDQVAIQTGLTGIQNVMQKIDMLPDSIEQTITPVISKDDDWLIAPSSGILHTDVSLGEHIKRGEKIGRLSDPFSNENSTTVTSHLDGIIVGVNRSPLIQEGVSIFKIASFIDNQRAQSILEEWEELKPENDE
jgi:hypothetical protein